MPEGRASVGGFTKKPQAGPPPGTNPGLRAFQPWRILLHLSAKTDPRRPSRSQGIWAGLWSRLCQDCSGHAWTCPSHPPCVLTAVGSGGTGPSCPKTDPPGEAGGPASVLRQPGSSPRGVTRAGEITYGGRGLLSGGRTGISLAFRVRKLCSEDQFPPPSRESPSGGWERGSWTRPWKPPFPPPSCCRGGSPGLGRVAMATWVLGTLKGN